MAMKTLTLALFILFSTLFSSSHSLPLSTKSRWIVDEETGKRVKLACANWEAHAEAMLPEMLDKQPLSHIANQIALMGFNCVRLTWATDMYTKYYNLTVAQRFHDLGLYTIEGIAKNNPRLLEMTLVDAQKAVIEELGGHGVMTALDNQVSKPMWCCGNDDGNGFWGDKYFDANEWLTSQAMVARRYKNTSTVIAMSIRNEIRGPLQNETVWRHYVELGAKTIHKENPNVLVLIGGLNYDLVFPNIRENPFNLDLKNKIVYEYHRYSMTEGRGQQWLNQPVNQFCTNTTQEIEDQVGFFFKGENAAPLFISEWGVSQAGDSVGDNLFLGCFLLYLAENDLDWALWALQGSYYFRDNSQDGGELYGMFNHSANGLNSPVFQSKLQIIQSKIQDPDSKEESYLTLYHPQSGQAFQVYNNVIHPTSFLGQSRWIHDGENTPIRLNDADLCLTATGDALPVTLTSDCTSEKSIWRKYSEYQIANKDDDGNFICLEYDPSYCPRLVTKKCIEPDNNLNVQTMNQWFKLITSNAY